MAGREPRPQGQGGCEVQGSIQDEKGLVKMSFNFSLYRLLAKPSAPTSSSVTRSLPRSTKIRRVTRPGTPCIDVTGQKTKSTVPKNLGKVFQPRACSEDNRVAVDARARQKQWDHKRPQLRTWSS